MNLIEDKISHILIKQASVMVFGLLSVVIFNLADAFYVSKLGVDHLAALGYVLPIATFIMSLALGFGIGVTAYVGRKVGESGNSEVGTVIYYIFIWGVIFAVAINLLFIVFKNLIFNLFDIDADVLVLVEKYIDTWQWSIIFIILPVVGNHILRALGDVRSPFLNLFAASLINIILDPVFIFGWKFVPAFSIHGAAIASLIARIIGFLICLYAIKKKVKILSLRIDYTCFYALIKNISHIWGPATVVLLLVPVGLTIITKLVSGYSVQAVAAFTISIRIQYFALTVYDALASVLVPFISQNLGAKKYNRIAESLVFSKNFAYLWGGSLFVLFILFGRPLVCLFSSSEEIVSLSVLYLKIVSLSYGLYGLMTITVATFNAVKKPLLSAGLALSSTFLISIPFLYIGSSFYNLQGIYVALFLAYATSGFIANCFLRGLIKKYQYA
ncbi:MAG: MATE family efflux transporter [Candidatus Scalindua sp.]|nr:MATE family efflux transporter [Candidatus Scalindua sp.]